MEISKLKIHADMSRSSVILLDALAISNYKLETLIVNFH